MEDFAELAAWMWERAEDDALLRACVETVEEGKELASRDEIFAAKGEASPSCCH